MINDEYQKQRRSLFRIIYEDLLRTYKWPLCLVITILLSSFTILVITQKIRVLFNEREQLLLERDVLQNEWRNLILEENVLADQKRIEKLAIERLKMRAVTQQSECVVVIKNKL